MGGLSEFETWHNLKEHFKQMDSMHLRDVFVNDERRAKSLSIDAGDLFLDYSKNRIGDVTMTLLTKLAREQKLESKRDAMFAGEKVNSSEKKAALHVALRNPADSHITVDGDDVMPRVRQTLSRMSAFVESIRSGGWKGATGKPIKNIINLGIGGSSLGPNMLYEALNYYSDRSIQVSFVSNLDPTDFKEATRSLDPEETMFIISTKSFSTDETISNTINGRRWISNVMGDDAIDKHFVAVTANVDQAKDFGLKDTQIFSSWEWVGGRYSLSGANSLAVMIAIGREKFEEFLNGMHQMDEHFRTTPLEENMPVIMALISIWNNNFFNAQSELVVPYSSYLKSLPAYLQQLSMESNGKSVSTEGEALTYDTAQINWGSVGTNAQHSYFQLLHQGTRFVPIDFIGFIDSPNETNEQHRKLMANMVAQSAALAFGHTAEQLHVEGVEDELLPHRAMPGNRPSNTILAPRLTPNVLGQIIALYEHKVFVQGIIWGINSFDQWGVELGKRLAHEVHDELGKSRREGKFDSSSEQLVDRLQKKKT